MIKKATIQAYQINDWPKEANHATSFKQLRPWHTAVNLRVTKFGSFRMCYSIKWTLSDGQEKVLDSPCNYSSRPKLSSFLACDFLPTNWDFVDLTKSFLLKIKVGLLRVLKNFNVPSKTTDVFFPSVKTSLWWKEWVETASKSSFLAKLQTFYIYVKVIPSEVPKLRFCNFSSRR